METTYRYRAVIAPTPAPPPSVSLVFFWSDGVHAAALREGRPLIVGRGEPSHVVIDDRSLSRTHARFSLENGRVRVEDLASTNGTLIAGERSENALLPREGSAKLGAVEVQVVPAQLERAASPSAPALRACLEQELTRSQFFGKPFALLAVVSSPQSYEAALRQVLRPVDVVDSYAPGISLVLLPEASKPDVLSLADALQRTSPKAYRVGAVLYPRSGGSAEELISLCMDALRAGGERPLHFYDGHALTESVEPIVHTASMSRVHTLLARAARTTIPVLILGETGSGKESLARAVHEQSPRARGPFKPVNCATIPPALVSATLFGHERGAFTGADRQAPGLFEQAHGGTLFLDEVGELPLEAQAALLRVLEASRLTRVGGAKEIDVDVRLVAATHRDLRAMVAAGTFRADLLYRLDAFALRVPPLRERSEDVPALANHFLALSRTRWATSATALSAPVLDALRGYPWPGNVRQLRNVVERAATVCAGQVVELDDLPDFLFERSDDPEPSYASVSQGEPSGLNSRIRSLEATAIREVLEKARGNQSEAARLLGIPRRTLANRVHALGLVRRR